MAKKGRDRIKRYFRHNVIALEMMDLVLGDHIDSGSFREVFYFGPDPKNVVKVELGSGSFHNVAEWQTYSRLYKTPMQKWLAPCIQISPCGVILVQKYAEDILESQLPREIPEFFTDLKPSNWGRVGKNIVCRDYGSSLLLENGVHARMKLAEWKLYGTPVKVP